MAKEAKVAKVTVAKCQALGFSVACLAPQS